MTVHQINVRPAAKSATSWPLFIAEAKGYYADHGLKINLTYSKGQADHLRLLTEGGADIGHQNADHVLRATVAGGRLRIQMRLTRTPYFLVARPGVGDGYEALRGHLLAAERVAYGHNFILQQMLQDHGLSPDGVQFMSDDDPDKRVEAMRDGSAVAGLFEVGASAEFLADGFTLLDNTEAWMKQRLGTVSAPQASWYESHHDEALAFVQCYLKAIDFLAFPNNRAEAASILTHYTGLSQRVGEITHELLTAHCDLTEVRRPVTLDEVTNLARNSVGTESLVGDVRLAELVSASVLQEALAAEGGAAVG